LRATQEIGAEAAPNMRIKEKRRANARRFSQSL
jgi:hypothetical protein